MFELLPYQQTAVASPARFTWNCWARQTGKSFTFSLRRLVRGLLRRRNQIILSAGERQSREVMEKVRQHCRSLNVWSEAREISPPASARHRRLELFIAGTFRLIALPANPMTARGYSGDVFLDEFAMHRDDRAIWAALFPTLLRGDGELDVASTPRGQKNVFYRLRSNPEFIHRTLTLEQAVAEGLKADVPCLRRAAGDELTWKQEFCCEFADEAASFMPHELIRQCQDTSLSTVIDESCLERAETELYAGVDVGRFRDLTAIWLWQRVGEQFTCRGVRTLSNAPFVEQEGEIVRLLENRAVRRCCLDASGLGIQLAERLAERFGTHRVEGVTFTNSLKSELAGRLRVFAERGQLRIPPDADIATDWNAVTRIVGGGAVRFDADRSAGGHADRFWAAALALHAADESPGAVGHLSTGRLTFARLGIW